MMRNNYSAYIASRGQGKTYILALFCIVISILFPGTKICVASATRSQANEVLSKITDDFMKNYSWGSENLKREIESANVGYNKAVIVFRNGSWIKVVTASDNARGNRANILICDEFWMIDLDTINTVLKRFLTAPRQPGYLNNPKYANLEERNKEVYAGSAWMQSHWSFDKCRTYFAQMHDDTKKYFICGLPYQIAIKEGLLSRKQIEDEMSEKDFDSIKFSMEMEALWLGDKESAFFALDDISKCRRLQVPIYPDTKVNKIPDLADSERRILSVDIALMASKKHKNDATSVFINRAIPTNNNDYIANIVYTENYEGLLTNELALKIRRLFTLYKCTDLVIDARGVGAGVLDLLLQDMVDNETGELYPALSCCNNKEIADRCKVNNAPEVIWAINASSSFNTEICTLLRAGFKNGKINLLVSDQAAKDILREKHKKMSEEELEKLRLPFINTTLLVYELINLQHEIKGTNIKITERTGSRKDRYSSLAYNYWVQTQLARELVGQKSSTSEKDFLEAFRQLNKKPILY